MGKLSYNLWRSFLNHCEGARVNALGPLIAAYTLKEKNASFNFLVRICQMILISNLLSKTTWLTFQEVCFYGDVIEHFKFLCLQQDKKMEQFLYSTVRSTVKNIHLKVDLLESQLIPPTSKQHLNYNVFSLLRVYIYSYKQKVTHIKLYIHVRLGYSILIEVELSQHCTFRSN